jgi:hypothetical protein
VHAFVDSAEQRLPELRAFLEDRRLPYSAIEQITPSIEDLFVSEVERQSALSSTGLPS